MARGTGVAVVTCRPLRTQVPADNVDAMPALVLGQVPVNQLILHVGQQSVVPAALDLNNDLIAVPRIRVTRLDENVGFLRFTAALLLADAGTNLDLAVRQDALAREVRFEEGGDLIG